MRRLFLILAKLIGLLQIFWGLTYLSSISLMMELARKKAVVPERYVMLGGILGFSVLCFGTAWLLLARTNWIADKLRIHDDSEVGVLKEDVVLRAGVRLIGVYIAIRAVSELPRAIVESVPLGLWQGRLIGLWTKILPAVLSLALGAFAMFRSEKIVDLITKASIGRDPSNPSN